MRLSLLSLTAVLLLVACGEGSTGKGGRWGKGDNEARQDPLVEVVRARRGSIPTLERSTGRVEARNFADVYAQLTEMVVEVRHDVGDHVEAGALLARLKADEQLLGLRSTELELQEAELLHGKNNLDLAKRKSELERIERYFDPNKPGEATLFSKEAHEAAKLEYDKALNAVQTSALALSRSQGAVAASALTLTHTDIRAPISGTITERGVRANEIVTSGALAFRIADFSVLEVKLDVAEARLSALRPPEVAPAVNVLALEEKVRLERAQAALLSVTAFPQERFLGYVDRIHPVVDDARGMIVVNVRVIQPADVDAELHGVLLRQFDPGSRAAVMRTAASTQALELRPGMWVDARIATQHIEDALLVPGAAVVGDSEVIWVVTPDEDNALVGTARPVDISNRRGVSSEGSVQITEARVRGGAGGRPIAELNDGDMVVVRGQGLLRDGQRVRIRDLSN